jgi:aminoglycoside 3-N-acetyltransferase
MYDLIEKGDTVLIHSSIGRTCREKGLSPSDILDILLEKVGKDGTLVFPSFTFYDWCHLGKFDIRNTPGRMGALSEAARKYPGSVRSGHPAMSFVAIGKYADMFDIDNNGGWGKDSPFDTVTRLNGKIALIDLHDQVGMSAHHYIENCVQANHRFRKEFTGQYISADDNKHEATYSLYVRKPNVVTWLYLIEEMLWDAGVYYGNRAGIGDGMRVCKAGEFKEFMLEQYRQGDLKGITWRYGKAYDE